MKTMGAALDAAEAFAARQEPQPGARRDDLTGAWYAGHCHATTRGKVWRGADGSWWYLVQQRGITGMTGSGVRTWAAAYAICLMYVDRFRREYR